MLIKFRQLGQKLLKLSVETFSAFDVNHCRLPTRVNLDIIEIKGKFSDTVQHGANVRQNKGWIKLSRLNNYSMVELSHP